MFKKFKRWNSYRKIAKLADKLLDSIEEEQKLSKNILKSKTFWLNLLALLNELIKILPMSPDIIPTVPTATLAVGLPIANVIVRKFTDQAVTVMPISKFDSDTGKRNF